MIFFELLATKFKRKILFLYLISQLKFCILSIILLLLIFAGNNAVAQLKPSSENKKTSTVETANSSTKRPRQRSQNPVFLGQKVTEKAIVPLGNQEVITDILVRFVDENGKLIQGKTKPDIITREFNLHKIDVGGTFFIDYATDLGSSDAVIGQPATVRNRPGSGLGYGLGLRAFTPIGAIRTEFALNDEGDTEFIVKIGDRF